MAQTMAPLAAARPRAPPAPPRSPAAQSICCAGAASAPSAPPGSRCSRPPSPRTARARCARARLASASRRSRRRSSRCTRPGTGSRQAPPSEAGGRNPRARRRSKPVQHRRGDSAAPPCATSESPTRGKCPIVSASNSLILARQITKRFGDLLAVDGIDFEVAKGEAFGFLGPNGAGKTSTMRMIGGVSPVTSGLLTIFGLDPAQHGPTIRARLGVVPQADTLDLELTVRENLIIYSRYFDLSWREGARRADELLEFVQLNERSGDKVDELSGGMKRRLTIARALINSPELLLLDEPTTGLDPQARHLVWDRLYRLKQQGVTLVLTTHYMDEAEQLCDRLVVMDRGKIAAEGSPRQLIETYSTPEVLELRFALEEQEQAADKLADVAAERIEVLADRILLYTADGDAALDAVRARGLEPVTSLVRRSTLEDVFLRLTGRRLEE